jgi:hypothetical protein
MTSQDASKALRLQKHQEKIMKTIMSGLIAMAVLVGIVAPASAADADGWSPQRFWQQQQSNLP